MPWEFSPAFPKPKGNDPFRKSARSGAQGGGCRRGFSPPRAGLSRADVLFRSTSAVVSPRAGPGISSGGRKTYGSQENRAQERAGSPPQTPRRAHEAPRPRSAQRPQSLRPGFSPGGGRTGAPPVLTVSRQWSRSGRPARAFACPAFCAFFSGRIPAPCAAGRRHLNRRRLPAAGRAEFLRHADL